MRFKKQFQMKLRTYFLFLLAIISASSCLSRKDVQYLQPNENLKLNEDGLVPIEVADYRITKTDILKINVITTPKGDAAQFYSSLIGSGGATGGATGGGSATGGGGNFYFDGMKLNKEGEIDVFGIGLVKAEGKTTTELETELQTKVNENFLPGKSQVRVLMQGIKYSILTDIDGKSLQKTEQVNRLNLLEVIALNGGISGAIDRKNVRVYRTYPEGLKMAKLDLTREDIVNSPYFWVQNNDLFLLDTRPRNLWGFGKDPLSTLTTGVTILTTALTVYLLFTR